MSPWIMDCVAPDTMFRAIEVAARMLPPGSGMMEICVKAEEMLTLLYAPMKKFYLEANKRPGTAV